MSVFLLLLLFELHTPTKFAHFLFLMLGTLSTVETSNRGRNRKQKIISVLLWHWWLVVFVKCSSQWSCYRLTRQVEREPSCLSHQPCTPLLLEVSPQGPLTQNMLCWEYPSASPWASRYSCPCWGGRENLSTPMQKNRKLNISYTVTKKLQYNKL